jgi:hypothetical protein
VIVVWRAIVELWRARQRKLDVQLLWPLCKQSADDLDHAKAAFFMHAMSDPAWLCLSEEEIIAQIDQLT